MPRGKYRQRQARISTASCVPNLLYNGFYENEEVQKNTLNKFSFNTVDELYAAIGYGGITLTKVINKVKDDVGKLRRQREQAERAAHPQNEQQQRRQNKSSDGVVVEGIDNCLVKFARCCTPIPGDEIVGFVTRGYGVSIHRRDCVNVHIEEEPDRWVRAWWDEDMAANAGHVNKLLHRSADFHAQPYRRAERCNDWRLRPVKLMCTRFPHATSTTATALSTPWLTSQASISWII